MNDYEKLAYKRIVIKNIAIFLDRAETMHEEDFLPSSKSEVPQEVLEEMKAEFDAFAVELEQQLSCYQLVRIEDDQPKERKSKAAPKRNAPKARKASAKPGGKGKATRAARRKPE